MSLRFHEIAESSHRLLNPFNMDKIALIGEICGLKEGQRILDLACGKGEMLSQWARTHGILGVGVDISTVFIEAAKERAYLLDVGDKVNFVLGDAADYPQEHHQFDVVSCLGATWIGNGLVGTLNLMKSALPTGGGLIVVGEPYWHRPATDEVAGALDVSADDFASLGGTLERIESAGFELLEMVLSNGDDWDRYVAAQWLAAAQYLDENPDDPEADELREWTAHARRGYLMYGRDYMGWGVFVLRPADSPGTIRKTKPTAQRTLSARPVGMEIEDSMLWVRLEDGRVIGAPVSWYPWLESAADDIASHIELTHSSVEWPALGQRIEIKDLLRT